jgi:hypothetical protein
VDCSAQPGAKRNHTPSWLRLGARPSVHITREEHHENEELRPVSSDGCGILLWSNSIHSGYCPPQHGNINLIEWHPNAPRCSSSPFLRVCLIRVLQDPDQLCYAWSNINSSYSYGSGECFNQNPRLCSNLIKISWRRQDNPPPNKTVAFTDVKPTHILAPSKSRCERVLVFSLPLDATPRSEPPYSASSEGHSNATLDASVCGESEEEHTLSAYGDLSLSEDFITPPSDPLSESGHTSLLHPKSISRPRLRLKVRRPPMPKRRLSYIHVGGPLSYSKDIERARQWPGSPSPIENVSTDFWLSSQHRGTHHCTFTLTGISLAPAPTISISSSPRLSSSRKG